MNGEASPPAGASDPRVEAAGRPWRWKRPMVVLACALGIAVNCGLYWPVLGYIVHGNNDFVCYYAAAQLSGTSRLYDAKAIKDVQVTLGDHKHSVVFTRLPYYGALISPLRLFGFDTAYWIWQIASLAGVVLFIWFWPGQERWVTALACCWSLPLLEGFISGQDVTRLLAVLAIAILLWSRGWHFAAGCVLSLCSIKYNLFLTLPLLIFGKRLWRVGAGMLAGGVVLWAACIAAGGWGWTRQYIAILTLPETTPDWEGMPNLRGLFVGMPHDRLWEGVGALLVILAAWMIVRGADFPVALAAVLASGLLISHHAFLRDAVLLVPACLLMMQKPGIRAYMVTGTLILCPLVYLPFLVSNPPIRPAAVILVPLLVLAAVELRIGTSQAADELG